MAAIWVLVKELTWAVVMALKSLEARFLIWSVDNLAMEAGLNELMIDMVAPCIGRLIGLPQLPVAIAFRPLVQVQNRTDPGNL
jgi:hypothetical protein